MPPAPQGSCLSPLTPGYAADRASCYEPVKLIMCADVTTLAGRANNNEMIDTSFSPLFFIRKRSMQV